MKGISVGNKHGDVNDARQLRTRRLAFSRGGFGTNLEDETCLCFWRAEHAEEIPRLFPRYVSTRISHPKRAGRQSWGCDIMRGRQGPIEGSVRLATASART